MPSSHESDFAQAVVDLHFCTQEQVNECLLIQSYEHGSKPALSEILVYKGYLTPNQERRVWESLNAPQETSPPEKPAALSPARAESSPLRPRRGGGKRFTCGFCSHQFEGEPDPYGRVACPSCHSHFTPPPGA